MSPATAAGRGSRAAGFTLVEILVALAVLGVAMGFGFQAFSGALASLDRSTRSQQAVTLAQTMLDRVGRDIALRAGDTAGRTEDGLRWRLRMTPYGNPAEPAPGSALTGIAVRVDVGWIEQGHDHAVSLSSVRLAQASARPAGAQ